METQSAHNPEEVKYVSEYIFVTVDLMNRRYVEVHNYAE